LSGWLWAGAVGIFERCGPPPPFTFFVGRQASRVMENIESATKIAIRRIRLFFPLPSEEQIAVALTEFWGSRAGSRIVELKPDMTMGEILDLAKDHLWTSPDFAHMLELAGIEAFDDQFEQMTFRDFVRYAASRKSESAQQGGCTE
jgi:hypothetical protein